MRVEEGTSGPAGPARGAGRVLSLDLGAKRLGVQLPVGLRADRVGGDMAYASRLRVCVDNAPIAVQEETVDPGGSASGAG